MCKDNEDESSAIKFLGTIFLDELILCWLTLNTSVRNYRHFVHHCREHLQGLVWNPKWLLLFFTMLLKVEIWFTTDHHFLKLLWYLPTRCSIVGVASVIRKIEMCYSSLVITLCFHPISRYLFLELYFFLIVSQFFYCFFKSQVGLLLFPVFICRSTISNFVLHCLASLSSSLFSKSSK